MFRLTYPVPRTAHFNEHEENTRAAKNTIRNWNRAIPNNRCAGIGIEYLNSASTYNWYIQSVLIPL